MSYGSDQQIDEAERICDEYCQGKIGMDEGIAAMKRIGLDEYEARALLQSAME